MALQDGDIVQLTVQQEFLGEGCENVFNIEVASVDDNQFLNAVARGFWNAYETQWKAVVSNLLSFTNIRTDNLTDGVSFSNFAITGTGGNTGSTLPSSSAVSVIMPRTSKLTRSGGKRFAGISEVLTDGNYITQTLLDSWNDFVGTWHNGFDLLGGAMTQVGTANFVIIGTNEITHRPDISIINYISECYARQEISTQRSRKPKFT